MGLLLMAAALVGGIPRAEAQLGREASFLQAVKKGEHREVKLMALGTINLNARDLDGTPALMLAIENGDGVMVSMLLREGADPDIMDRESGETALTMAAGRNSEDLVRRLLEGGADSNLENRGFETALIKAVHNANRAIIRQLIAAGADPQLQDVTGHSALWYAETARRSDLVNIMKKGQTHD